MCHKPSYNRIEGSLIKQPGFNGKYPSFFQVLEGLSRLGYVVNHHGDRKSPSVGLWDPFQMAVLWLMHGGDPSYLQVQG